MKEKITRRIAFLLAFLLFFETAFTYEGMVVGATETGKQDIQQSISVNTVNETESETVSEAVDTQNTETDDMDEENVQRSLLNYLYVEKDNLNLNDTQHMFVSIGDGSEEVTEATLSLLNTDTDEVTTLTADEIIDDMAVFSKQFTGQNEKGVYQAVEVSYTINGETSTLDLKEIGILAFFGVEKTIVYNEDTSISPEDVEANIITTDGLEIDTTADKIAETLAEVSDTGSQYSKEGLGETSQTKNFVNERATGDVVIVLDPGHDATHCGASGNGLREEDLNLKIATYCKEELENYDGVVVHMTRSGTACPNPGTIASEDNAARVQYAKSVGASAYISIHINSSTSSGPSGAAVYYPNSNYNAGVGNAGKGLATKIQAQLVALGLKNNGIQIRNSADGTTYPNGSLADYYGVIRLSKLAGFPAIIIEHAFVSNSSDAANFLNSDDKLKKLGIADATGIAEHFGLTKGTGNGTVSVTDVNYAKGTFKVSVKGIDQSRKVVFKVYPKEKQTKDVTYEATYKSGVHSATVNVKYHDYTPGKYTIVAYFINVNGKQSLIGKKEFDFSEPKFSNVRLTASATSGTMKKFKLSTSALKDASGVVVEVYHKSNKKGSLSEFELKANSSKEFSYVLPISKLKLKMGGTYQVVFYAYTCFNTKKKIGSTTFTLPSPTMGGIKLASQDDKKGSFQLVISDVKSDSGISSVTCEVWSKADKSDLKVYKATKGTEGKYVVKGNIKYHNYNYGRYQTRVTLTGKNGIQKISKVKAVKIKQPVAVVTAKVSNNQSTTQITADNVLLSGNVTDVKIEVCSKAGKKRDKVTYAATRKTKAKWTANVKNTDIAKAGLYYVTVYAKSDRNTKYTKVGTTTYEVTGPTIEASYITDKQAAKGTFKVNVTGVKCKGGISRVEVLAFSASGSREKGVTYVAKKNGNKYVAKVNIADLGGKKGTYKIIVTAYSKAGIAYSSKVISTSMKNTVPTGLYPIMGATSVTVDQMVNYYNAYAAYPAFYAGTDAPNIRKFCSLYIAECGAEGVRAEVAFVQAMKETNFLRYGGDVNIGQFNFAGLGAVGGGASGASFPNVKTGIRAQVQHLKAYASNDPLIKECVDSRFTYVARNSAPYVEWLGIKENPSGKGWATDPGYGTDIVKRIAKLKSF